MNGFAAPWMVNDWHHYQMLLAEADAHSYADHGYGGKGYGKLMPKGKGKGGGKSKGKGGDKGKQQPKDKDKGSKGQTVVVVRRGWRKLVQRHRRQHRQR